MATKVRVIAGTDPDVLTHRVLQEYAAALAAGRERQQPDVGLWLTPTQRSLRDVTRRLISQLGHVCWSPGLHTFDSLARSLLQRAGHPATAISSMVRRLLLRRITQQLSSAGALPHFQPVSHTTGFLDVVESLISELKRDEVWPEDFLKACQGASDATQRDSELGQIYQCYQDILLERNWYDAEGKFWLARNELAEGRCDPLPEWTYIAVVGFSDFTSTQHEILELLARRTNELVFTLPWDDSRPELFAKARGTWEQLHRTWPDVRREAMSSATDEPAFRTVLRERLFVNPRKCSPVATSAGLEVVATTGPRSEYAAVARRIKSLLAEGVSAGDIVVGLRSLTTDGLPWMQALCASGLPAWCEIGAPVKEQGLVKFLIAILHAELEDWSFHRLLAVFDSSYFQPNDGAFEATTPARAVSLALRRMQLPDNRQVILNEVERAAKRPHPSAYERDPDERQPLEVLARQAWPLLRWYADQTEALRRSHTLAEWIDVVAKLVGEVSVVSRPLSVARRQERSDLLATDDGQLTTDLDLWQRLQRTLRDAAVAEAKASQQSARLSTAEFLAEFRDLIAEERLEPPAEHPGCVRVLSFDQIRHISIPHLFLVGLNEESFPRRRTDDCLFTDAERERLASDRGLSLLHQARHQQEEMLFFHSLLMRAGRRLTISYPEIDQKGQPVFCSPYLVALQTLFTPEALPVQREGQLDPVPPAEQVLSSEDVRLVAMEAALSGHAGWLRTLGETTLTRPVVQNLRAAVEMAAHRFHTSGFTIYEGRLEAPQHYQALAERFGPRHQFSATELEAYAVCPFRFWLQSVLEIEPLAEPTEDPDRRRRGQMVHDVVAQLLDPMRQGIAPQALAEQFRAQVAERLERQPTHNELQRALTRIEQELLDEWANAYARQVDEYAIQVRDAGAEDWSKADSELSFGNVRGERGESDRPTHPPLELGSADQQVLVCGRIDRVDFRTADRKPVYSVIDYKTGGRPKFTLQEVESGRALQLALYTLAVQRLGIAPADAVPFQLGYWCLRETGFSAGPSLRAKKPTAIEAAVWRTLVEILETVIPRLAAGIRRGEFVVENADDKCTGHCSFHTVCRVNQVRNVAEVLRKHRDSTSTVVETPS